MGTTICIILLFMANSSNVASIGEHADADNDTLQTEIEQLHGKIGQMAEVANVQNATIAQLRATIEQQAKEVSARSYLTF
jgi:Spy/CpxP family protein refolding chaperone